MGSPRCHQLAVVVLAFTALAIAGCQPVQISSGDATQSNSQSGESQSGDGDARVDTTNYQVNQAVSEVRLDGSAGDVEVLAGDGPITVTETARFTDDKPATSHQVNGSTLALTASECAHVRTVNGRCEVDWRIRAPAATNLTLRSGAGGITVTGFSGNVSARSGSGGVTGTGLAARSVTAKSSAGEVDLRFTQPPDQVSASSSAGEVDIRLPDATSYDVHAHSSTSDPDVSVRTDTGSPHKIDARTSAGSIDIRPS